MQLFPHFYGLCVLPLVVFSASCSTLNLGKNLEKELFSINARLDEITNSIETSQEQLDKKITDAHKTLARLNQAQAGIQRSSQHIQGKITALEEAMGKEDLPAFLQSERLSVLKSITTLRKDLDLLEASMTQLSSQVSADLDQRIAKHPKVIALEKNMRSVKKSLASAASSSAAAPKGLGSIYEARDAYKRKQYTKLRQDIPRLLPKMKYESSKEDLRYFYAEALFYLGDKKGAAVAYANYLEAFPQGKYLKTAKFRLARSYQDVGEHQAAFIYYEEVMTEFAGSQEALEAAKYKETLATSTEKS